MTTRMTRGGKHLAAWKERAPWLRQSWQQKTQKLVAEGSRLPGNNTHCSPWWVWGSLRGRKTFHGVKFLFSGLWWFICIFWIRFHPWRCGVSVCVWNGAGACGTARACIHNNGVISEHTTPTLRQPLCSYSSEGKACTGTQCPLF